MATNTTEARETLPGKVSFSGGPLPKTKKRVLTKRGVMWLGQTCNLRCFFCYFVNRISDPHHPEHAFMTLDKAKAICQTLRDFYGNTAIDIQGGEPTIYPDILDLVRYCNEIGLYPTLITNGIVLAKPGTLEKYQEAGIRDFLVSLHGTGQVHDEVVGRKGAYEKTIAAVARMRELDIPFRFNCTMSEPVVPLLPEIARKAIHYGARVVNYIAFNPFGDQETGVRTDRNVPRYAAVKEKLSEAIDLLEEAGIECNVRYLPLCMAEPRHRKNFYNYQQLSYDLHEWDFQSWLWTMMQTQMMHDHGITPPYRFGPYDRAIYKCDSVALTKDAADRPLLTRIKFGLQRRAGALETFVRGEDEMYRREAKDRAAIDCKYKFHEACSRCAMRNICDGFHGDYADLFGTEEATPITDEPVADDPRHCIKDQEKVVEPEDQEWAL